MFGANKGKAEEKHYEGEKLHIAIVQSRFNTGITNAMTEACVTQLEALNVRADHIHLFSVPGALEVPSVLQALAVKDDYDALIAIGCVIRGDTYHFELVCNESAAGVTRVALDHQIPIANAVLTVENMEQAIARQTEKAQDAARVAVEMANLLYKLV